MMMAKKRGKKKGAGKKTVGTKVPNVGGAGGGGGGGGDVAVAEAAAAAAATGAASPAVAAAAAVEENAKAAAAGGVSIKNRAGNEQSVAIPPAAKATTLDAAAAASVNGGAASPRKPATAAAAAGGGATKGFGAPAPPQPRPVQKGLNKGPKPMKAPQQGGRGAQSAPPPKQTGFDALASGVPVAGQTDHQKVLYEVLYYLVTSYIVSYDSSRYYRIYGMYTNIDCVSLSYSTFVQQGFTYEYSYSSSRGA